MSAKDDMLREIAKLGAMTDDVFVGVVGEAYRSIQNGSEITGAPGQPVQTGNLLASWQETYPTPDQGQIATNADYAETIEDGVGRYGPLTLRSEVGGFHSKKLTEAGLPHIVDVVTQRVVRGQSGFNNGSAGWSGEDGG